MELWEQSFLKIKKVHIGSDCSLMSARILCGKSVNEFTDLGYVYRGKDICKICLIAYSNGRRVWTPNALAGSGSKNSVGGYGGSVTNER